MSLKYLRSYVNIGKMRITLVRLPSNGSCTETEECPGYKHIPGLATRKMQTCNARYGQLITAVDMECLWDRPASVPQVLSIPFNPSAETDSAQGYCLAITIAIIASPSSDPRSDPEYREVNITTKVTQPNKIKIIGFNIY
jgi:hypothetical protein